MIYVHWIILAVYTLLTIAAMVTVLMDRRQPAKTMAWMLVLIFLPAVGIILYFFFGQNTRKERVISQKSMDQLTKRSMLEFVEQKNLQLPDRHLSLIHLFVNQSFAMPFQNTRTEIYTCGYEFFPALLSAVAQAKSHIHLDTYIIEDDPLGNLLADALIAKAHQGVEVRLIYDDVGSWKTKNTFFERLRNEGIEVHPYLPVRFPSFTSKVNYRNHRKLCIIDGTVGFIGGMNIAMRYVKGIEKKEKEKDGAGRKRKQKRVLPWRDTHLRVEGRAVYGLQRAFLIDWYFVDRTLISNRRYYPSLSTADNKADGVKTATAGDRQTIAQVVTSNPTSPWPDIMQGYVRILLEAKEYVYMETPYFLPTEPILFAMRTAALTGVDVRLMIPYHADSKLMEWASRSYVVETVEAGVKVYLYQAGFNHSKLLVADDSVSTCGSTNIDFRSFENNFEANIFFYGEEMALRMKEVFLRDQEQSLLLDDFMDMEHRPFVQRLWESLVRLLSPLL